MQDASRYPTNGEGIPIVALDIDGTLGDYHSHFLRFAEKWLDMDMPPPREINPGMRLHEFMGVSIDTYRNVKMAYRQGGLKRMMPVYPWASNLTSVIQDAGAQVWICTTRPYLRLDNIDPDTREWLRRHDIRFNAVLFGDNKYQELQRQAGHRVAAVVDDLPEMCDAATDCFSDAGIYIKDQPYNKSYQNSRVRRVFSLHALAEYVTIEIRQWIGTQQ